MNIFVLDPDPAIAASLHCDQHLSKMILESAQMLSTVASKLLDPPTFASGNYYKPTHVNHPCTLWAGESLNNSKWIVSLCEELDNIRMSLGSDSHKSMEVLKQFNYDLLPDIVSYPVPKEFIFCGPGTIKYRSDLTIYQKYKELYKLKAKQWILENKAHMSYKGRKFPEFLSEVV